MQTSWNENQMILRGTLTALPVYSHENHGVHYETFPLSVARLSGAEDRLNIVATCSLLASCALSIGAQIDVIGEVRSFNNRNGSGSKLVITVYARSIALCEGEAMNQLTLAGVLCKPPILRRTPLGRDICDLMLAVNRKYGRADYLPCIAWGVLAQHCGELAVGEAVRLDGRLQSRIYQKVVDGATREKTAFEISVMQLERLEIPVG